jgi:hypothetical protein
MRGIGVMTQATELADMLAALLRSQTASASDEEIIAAVLGQAKMPRTAKKTSVIRHAIRLAREGQSSVEPASASVEPKPTNEQIIKEATRRWNGRPGGKSYPTHCIEAALDTSWFIPPAVEPVDPATEWTREVLVAWCGGAPIPEKASADIEDFQRARAKVAELMASKVAVPEGYTPVRNDVIAFLKGYLSLSGAYFGDGTPDGERGAFWWRRYLPDLNQAGEQGS